MPQCAIVDDGPLEKGMSLLEALTKQYNGRAIYDRFELVITGVLLVLISIIIVYTTILVGITLIEDFATGMKFMDGTVFKDTFGLILTILILLEFNHSIVAALRQRAGAIQVRVIVLITITVIARKIILLDYASASIETLLGLGGLALALGALYWLLTGVEQRKRSTSPLSSTFSEISSQTSH